MRSDKRREFQGKSQQLTSKSMRGSRKGGTTLSQISPFTGELTALTEWSTNYHVVTIISMHKFVNNTATAAHRSRHSLFESRIQDTVIAMLLNAQTSPLRHFPVMQSIISFIETTQWAVLRSKSECAGPSLTSLGSGARTWQGSLEEILETGEGVLTWSTWSWLEERVGTVKIGFTKEATGLMVCGGWATISQ